jgi:hypothetical protein
MSLSNRTVKLSSSTNVKIVVELSVAEYLVVRFGWTVFCFFQKWRPLQDSEQNRLCFFDVWITMWTAGGYDAIWVLIFTPPSLPECSTAEKVVEGSGNIQHVIEFLNHWSHSSVRVLSSDSWVVGGSTNELRESSDDGHDDDGIKIFNDLQLVDCLKSQLDLFSWL